jgi:hypothetical protein
MTTLTQTVSSTEKYINQYVSKIETEAPIVKQETFNIITALYAWGKTHPVKTAAIIGFIVGFILGTLV